MSLPEQFSKPDHPPDPKVPPTSASQRGISAFHINQAREQVKLHTLGRLPPTASASAVARGPEHTANTVIQNTQDLHARVPLRNPSLGTTAAPNYSDPHHNHYTKAQVSVPAKSHNGKCENPQCGHCGTVIIPLPKASFPFEQNPSITVNDWSIYTMKGPILLLDELDHLNDTRFEFPLPEMIFGNNHVRLVNDKTGAAIEFNTLDALDSLNEEADFKVSYYEEWLSTRPKAKADAVNKEALAGSGPASGSGSVSGSELESVKPYDWTYSTNYKGTLTKAQFKPTEKAIPVQKLLRPDPILFFDESILFEDELGDNGISMLSTKVRVMHLCLLLLCRFFLRVNDVAFRIRDTRIFIDFESNEVLREYKTQEALYDDMCQKLPRTADPKRHLRDAGWVSQNMPLVNREIEELVGELSKEASLQS